jgi:hypothetical protein
MSDSTADTNIPVTRLPFGAELPPKVPYSTTDSVGVGDAASENLPVQVNNRQIVAVGTSSNPMRAIHLKRKNSGKTVNDVPTSDTPNADDPDTMIATKQYVDSAGGFINGSYYIRFTASRSTVKDATPYKVYFSSDDTVDGLQTEAATGKKFKWLCRNKINNTLNWITSSTDNTSVGYLQQFNNVSTWSQTKRFANDNQITRNINALIYKVQHDCLLHIDLGEGTGKSSDYGTVAIYTGDTWIQIANFKEFSGNTDMNSSIAFPCKAGTLIRCLYGEGKLLVKIEGNRLVLQDTADGSVFYQKR